MKTCIIHIGMHKTGSSSIQETFSSLDFRDVEYLDLGSPNHSGFFATLFGKNPENYHGNVKAGRTPADVYALRDRYRDLLSSRLSSTKKSSVMISAEDLSHPFGDGRIENLKSFLDPYFDKIKVFAYVRPPVSFMESAFQQMVKGGVGFLNLDRVYPNYRARFEPYDDVFGKENVQLVPFDPDFFFGRDVVLDLANRLGVSLKKEEVIRVNEGLSLEATALLYAYRKYGPEYGAYQGATRDNNRVISKLRVIGESKLRFHHDLVSPVLSRNQSDISWVQSRLDYDFKESPRISEGDIKSEGDLLKIAESRLDDVSRLLEEQVKMVPDAESAAKAINSLRYFMTGRLPSGELSIAAQKNEIENSVRALLKKEKIAPVVIFRELALSFERSGDIEAALKMVDTGLAVNPNAPGILNIKERLTSGQLKSEVGSE